MQVKKIIEMLSKYDPNEELAFTGYWERKHVEFNNEVDLTDDQWNVICDKHEDNPEIHIDEIVSLVLREENE